MEIISTLLVSISLFFTGFFAPAEPSVEVGISSLSPAGIDGGYAVPASGCSGPTDCNAPVITADKTLVPPNEPVEICWNPSNHHDCKLSKNLTGNANQITCETVTIQSSTRFAIQCIDGTVQEDSVIVDVTPTMYEI